MNILNLCLRYYPSPGGAEFLNKIAVDKLTEIYGCNFNIIATYLEDHVANKIMPKTSALFNDDKKNRIRRCGVIKIPGTVYHISPGFITAGLFAQCDIIHSWTMMYFPALAGVILKKLKNKPLILNPIVDENNIAYRQKYSKTIGKTAISQADHLILLTEYSRKVLEKNNFNFKNCDVIPAGVDIEEFENFQGKSEFCQNGKFNILFTGRLAAGKGIDILFAAINILRKKKVDFHLNIAGPDFGEKKNMELFVKENSLQDFVTFCGNISRFELVSLYKSSNLFVLPSRYEAFGIVFIEAMAAGIPVIGADVSAIPYIIKDCVNGFLIKVDDINQLVEKIEFVMNNSLIAKKITTQAFNEVKDKYNWNSIAKKYYDVYKKFV